MEVTHAATTHGAQRHWRAVWLLVLDHDFTKRRHSPNASNSAIVPSNQSMRPQGDKGPHPLGAFAHKHPPGLAYTNNLRSYPLAERGSLLRQRRCGAALAKRLASHTGNHQCGLLKVRFPPNNDRTADAVLCQLCANRRHHSITSSAEASTCGRISRPKVLAVLRLMTSSNLVARKTGISAGLSPLSTRPV